jgi:hypothetical protein
MLTPDSPIVLLAQLAFYGGLLALMVGLPLFIWLAVRACRDLHSISESLHWIAHCTKSDRQIEPAHSRQVANSAFGR